MVPEYGPRSDFTVYSAPPAWLHFKISQAMYQGVNKKSSIPNAVAMHMPSFVQYHTRIHPPALHISQMPNVRTLSVDLIERSRVVEAALPHLVNDLLRVCLVFDLRSCLHGQLGASAHASLQLFCDAPLIPCEELACETTLSAQSACADLQTLVSTICGLIGTPYL